MGAWESTANWTTNLAVANSYSPVDALVFDGVLMASGGIGQINGNTITVATAGVYQIRFKGTLATDQNDVYVSMQLNVGGTAVGQGSINVPAPVAGSVYPFERTFLVRLTVGESIDLSLAANVAGVNVTLGPVYFDLVRLSA
jgi:hypothetical protein